MGPEHNGLFAFAPSDPASRRPLAGLSLWAAALIAALAAGTALADAGCQIGKLGELPVTMVGTRPIVHALINGKDAAFVADSGAFYNMLTPAAAAQYQLPLTMAPFGYFISGVGGDVTPHVATIKEFTILGVKVANVQFIVAGNDLSPGIGLLGENLFRFADTEYDLANGVIRFMRAGDGCKSLGLAYWVQSTSKAAAYSQIDIEHQSDRVPHIIGYAYVNGQKTRVMFDTGASSSVLSVEAAARAGITPSSEGVIAAGVSTGIGQHYARDWIAPFKSFKIGDEEIRDIKMHVGEIGGLNSRIDMLLGADFFLSHRIYVASSRAKLYFTYNGGPVFNLGIGSRSAQSGAEAVAAASGGAVGTDEPADAAAFSRRATASSARGDFASAIADLNRACQLAPDNPDYLYQRGMAQWGNHQGDLAHSDFNAALKLKADYVPALLARAGLNAHEDPTAAVPDLEAADRYLPKEDPQHLEIADAYREASMLPAAIVQYSKWIDSHQRTDVRMPEVLNARCWVRALLNQDLPAALADCNGAVRLQPKSPSYLDSRGLVYLRMGNYDKSVADYDAAIALGPRTASARYCRGIARLRQGHAAEGQADIAAALAQSPTIGEFYTRHGLSP